MVLSSSNTTVGGPNPQENNVICGNGPQGVLIQPGASGNQVLGNQIGMVGPAATASMRRTATGPRGSDPVLGQSPATREYPLRVEQLRPEQRDLWQRRPRVRISGVGANRNLIQGNYIGVAPGGGYLFGTGNPGNGDAGDGVRIEDGSRTRLAVPRSD